jgi:retron-type reverse transcriptase
MDNKEPFNWEKEIEETRIIHKQGRPISGQGVTLSFHVKDTELINWLNCLSPDMGTSRSSKIYNILKFAMQTDELLEENSKYGDERTVIYKLKKAVENTYLDE